MKTGNTNSARIMSLYRLTGTYYNKNTADFVFEYYIKVNGKDRKITAYKKGRDGGFLKFFHREFDGYLRENYTPSPRSFAYKEGSGIHALLREHTANDVFLKMDIHHFFDTVDRDVMNKIFSAKKETRAVIPALDSCFYNGHLPIGFVTSPVLSDMYLHSIDEEFENEKGIIYTRYADDFIISASGENAGEILEGVRDRIVARLREKELVINAKKTYIRRLKAPGDAIHLLGLNMVKNESGENSITVSDRYIRQTCREFCEYLKIRKYMPEKFRKARFSKILGKIMFIADSSERSKAKFRKMLFVKSGVDTEIDYKHLKEYK